MTAAFELTRPVHDGKFAVTIYQQGWRLGGKGASGRGPHARIEEHGLHLWMGWYDNAFRLMRDCYGELNRDPVRCRIAHWRDAFKPDHFTGAMEQTHDGAWRCWSAALPPAPGLPGDPYEQPPRWTVADYMVRASALLQTLLTTLATGLEAAAPRDRPFTGEFAPAGVTADQIGAVVRLGHLGSLTALIQGAEMLSAAARGVAPGGGRMLQPLLDTLASSMRVQLEALVSADDESRRLWTIMDLTLATMRGIVRHNLATHPRGFEAIDDYDCREWLLLNGASRQSVDSGYLRALYDLGFAYEDGDPQRPRLAAGQALRSMLRAFFTYRGAFFWKMQSGMGDVVFAPLYEVLRRRGVRFEFFHRLENVGIDWRGTAHVSALDFDVQARTASGEAYEPLVDVRGLPCWPSEPLWDRLEHGRRMQSEGRDFENFFEPRSPDRRTLRVEKDFDLVVLAVGLGAVPYVCRELVERDARWRAMVHHVKTVATQAFQLWLTADMRELGWPHPPINVSGFVEPFDTWADMSHLGVEENWPRTPRAIAYFCNALPDLQPLPRREQRDWVARNRDRVRENALRFLARDIASLWPSAVDGQGRFRWDLLCTPQDRRRQTGDGPATFDSQYWVGSVNPSDRYVLTLPGSTMYRISPLDRTYDNLTIAGDWTDCGFNAGCVEAAVMSGMLAAHALSLRPALADIVGYDHP
jgi:uncharacterized protein with NAD-binding domain and iron-sulfur cluster